LTRTFTVTKENLIVENAGGSYINKTWSFFVQKFLKLWVLISFYQELCSCLIRNGRYPYSANSAKGEVQLKSSSKLKIEINL